MNLDYYPVDPAEGYVRHEFLVLVEAASRARGLWPSLAWISATYALPVEHADIVRRELRAAEALPSDLPRETDEQYAASVAKTGLDVAERARQAHRIDRDREWAVLAEEGDR